MLRTLRKAPTHRTPVLKRPALMLRLPVVPTRSPSSSRASPAVLSEVVTPRLPMPRARVLVPVVSVISSAACSAA